MGILRHRMKRRQAKKAAPRTRLRPEELEHCEVITCPNCGHDEFDRRLRLKRVPAELSGAGEDSTALVPIDRCCRCGRVVDPREALDRFKKGQADRVRTQEDENAAELGSEA